MADAASNLVSGARSPKAEPQTCGTSEDARIWCNNDRMGVAMAAITLCCLVYGDFVVLWVCLVTETFSLANAIAYTVLTFLAVWAHVKTMLTDPGTLPQNAQPLPPREGQRNVPAYACGRCDAFKPPRTHHCRTCGRCIIRMDHHCPWMNNCVGATNLKHFFLFLIYTCTCCIYALALILRHFIECELDNCSVYTEVDTNLVRVALVIAFSGMMFTFSMLTNQVSGVLTGIGTVDRMQRRKKERVRGHPEDYKPVPWSDVFGTGPKILWFFPIDVKFTDRDKALGYTVPPPRRRNDFEDA